MAHSLSTRFAASIAALSLNPFELKISFWFFEILLLFMDLRLVLTPELAKLVSPIPRRILTSTLLYQFLEEFDIQRIVTSINNPTTVWTILIALLTCLVLISARLIQPERSKANHSAHSEERKAVRQSSAASRDAGGAFQDVGWLITRATVGAYGYVFYIVGYFTTTVFMCKSIPETILLSSVDGGLAVVSSNVQIYDSNIETKYVTRWSLDMTKNCFGGDYYIMGTFALCVILMSLFLKVAHSIYTGIYPSPVVHDCRRNQLELIPQALFWFALMTRTVAEVQRTSSLESLYYILLLSYQLITLIILLLGRPFHNKTLVKLKVFKCICVLSYISFVMLTKSGVNSADELAGNWLTRSTELWVTNFIAASLVLMLICLLVDSIYSRSTLTEPSSLVHFFEAVKKIVASETGTHLSGRDLKTVTEVFAWASRHKKNCSDPMCDCSKLSKWEGSIAAVDVRTVRIFHLEPFQKCLLFYCTKMLHENIFKNSRNLDQSESETKHALILWTNFMLRNVSPDLWGLHLLLTQVNADLTARSEVKDKSAKSYGGDTKIRAKYEFEGKQKAKIGRPDTNSANFDTISFDFRVILSILKAKIEKLDGHHRLMGCIGDLNQKVLNRNADSKPIEISPVLDFIRDSHEAEHLMFGLFNNREEILQLFESQGDPHILSLLSIRQQDLHKEFEKVFSRLQINGNSNFYRTALIRGTYLMCLKEDINGARKFLAMNKKFRLTSNLTALVDTGASIKVNSNGIVVGVSGESENLHSIVSCTINVTQLGYKYLDLLGEDLKCLIPSTLASLHKSFMSYQKFSIRPAMLRPILHLHVMNSDGYIIPSDIEYRISSLLHNGLQYIGLLMCDDSNANDQLVQALLSQEKTINCNLLLNLDGQISDLNRMSKFLFSKGVSLAEFSPKLRNFFADFVHTHDIEKFGKIWEGKIKAAQALKTYQLMQTKKATQPSTLVQLDEKDTNLPFPGSPQHSKKTLLDMQVDLVKQETRLLVPQLSHTKVFSQDEMVEVIENNLGHQHAALELLDKSSETDFVDPTPVVICCGEGNIIQVSTLIKIEPVICYAANRVFFEASISLLQVNGSPICSENIGLLKSVQGSRHKTTKAVDDWTTNTRGFSACPSPEPDQGHQRNDRLTMLAAQESLYPHEAKQRDTLPAALPESKKNSPRGKFSLSVVKPKNESVVFQPLDSKNDSQSMVKMSYVEAKSFNKVKPAQKEKTILQSKMQTMYSMAKSHTNSNEEVQDEAGDGQMGTPQAESVENLELMKMMHKLTQGGGMPDQASTAHATATDLFSVAKCSQLMQRSFAIDYSKTAGWIITFPMVILLAYLVGSYYYETWAYNRFSGLPLEMNTHDAESYHFWNMLLFVHYINIKRLSLEGMFDEEVMNKYGFGPTLDRIVAVTYNPGFQNQLWVGADCRYARNTYQSNYSEFFDQHVLSSDFREYMFYNPDTAQFEMQLVNARDGARYTQGWLNRVLQTDLMAQYRIGDTRNKRLSPYEHVVRWNLHNPHLERGLKSRLILTLVWKMDYDIADRIVNSTLQSSWRPLWTGLAASGFFVLAIIVVNEILNQRQRSRIISIAEFERTVVEEEKLRLMCYMELLRKYSIEESTEFLHELERDPLLFRPKVHVRDHKSSQRSNGGTKKASKDKKVSIFGTKKALKQKYSLSKKTSLSLSRRYPLGLRALVILSFISLLAFIRYYFMTNSIREATFLFRTFQKSKDIYMGLIGGQVAITNLALYAEGDTMLYRHPIEFLNYMMDYVTKDWVPGMLKLAADNADLTTGKLLNTLLYDVQFCDMLQLTAENNTLYSNCESALGGTTQNTIAQFLQQYPKLILQYGERWKLENTRLGKDSLLKAEEFASLISFSSYNQFGTCDALYYHFNLPLSVQLNRYIADSLVVTALTNVITGLIGAVIAVVGIHSLYSSSQKRFSELPSILISVPIRLFLSNPQFKLMTKNITTKGTFWGVWV